MSLSRPELTCLVGERWTGRVLSALFPSENGDPPTIPQDVRTLSQCEQIDVLWRMGDNDIDLHRICLLHVLDAVLLRPTENDLVQAHPWGEVPRRQRHHSFAGCIQHDF